MKPLLLFLLLSTAAWGQDSTMNKYSSALIPAKSYFKVSKPEKWSNYLHDEKGKIVAYKRNDSLPVIEDWEKFFELLDKEPKHKSAVDTLIGNFDLVPVTLLVRIQGRPWAFFHDGWEVRKVDSAEIKKSVFANAHGYVPSISVVETVPIYSHLLYLDSRKRPIRKEWVVYQTFKR